jgi:hypothetical protein
MTYRFVINFKMSDIIPIEIKCIRNEKNLFSKTIMRELKMAKEQLKTIKSIINKCDKGLIVFMYIIDSYNTFCEYTMIDI